MKSNDKYEKLKQLFSFLIKERGFSLVHENPYNEKSFGNAFAELVSEAFRIQLIVDRGDTAVYISPNNVPEDWMLLETIRSMVLGTDPLYGTDEENSTFLKEHFEEVKNLFSKENIEETMRQVNKIREERNRRQFPQLYEEKDQEQKQ